MTHLPSNFCECKSRLTILKPVKFLNEFLPELFEEIPLVIRQKILQILSKIHDESQKTKTIKVNKTTEYNYVL
jgi:hypothetical protein